MEKNIYAIRYIFNGEEWEIEELPNPWRVTPNYIEFKQTRYSDNGIIYDALIRNGEYVPAHVHVGSIKYVRFIPSWERRTNDD